MRDGKETEGEAFLGTENKSEIKKRNMFIPNNEKKDQVSRGEKRVAP